MSSRVWLLGIAALVGVAAVGLTRLEIDNSAQAFVPEPTAGQQRLVELFGPDDVTRVVLLGAGARETTSDEWLAARALELRAVPGVLEVLGPAAAVPAGLRGGLASASASSLVVVLEPAPLQARRTTVRTIEQVVSVPAPAPRTEVVVVGLAQLDRALDKASREIGRRQFPLLVAITLGLLWWVLGAQLMAPVLVVAAVLLGTFGMLGWLGIRLDLVVSVLPPLLFAMGIATTLHLVMRWREHGAGELALDRTWTELRWAVLWSGVSTMAGFLSLAIAPVLPVRHLGIAAAGGIGFLTLMALLVLPRLLERQTAGTGPMVVRASERRCELLLQRLGAQAALLALSRPRTILLAAAAIASVALAGVPRITLESDATRYLAADHPLRLDFARVEDAGLSVAAVHVLIEVPSASELPTAEQFRAFEMSVATSPTVLSVTGPAALPHPALDPLGYQLGVRSVLADGGKVARVVVSVRLAGIEELDVLVRRIEGSAAEHLGVPAAVTGTYSQLLATQRTLFATLGWSLASTTATIGLLLLVLLRSVRRAVVALVPNLWPVACVLGMMGWFGLPLDLASVLVGAIVIGLAVDNSLHLLGGVRRLEPSIGLRAALVETLTLTTPAIALTALVLVLGFGGCAFSSFLPTARFGVLASAAIALAMVADLLVLPALLVVGRGSGSGTSSRS